MSRSVKILEARSQQQFARRVGKKKLAENQRGDEVEIVDEMSEDEATINDCPDHNDMDIVSIPGCSTAFIDTISLTFSKQITTYQETYAIVDKL